MGIGQHFMEQTMFRFLKPSGQMLGKPQPPLELEPELGKRIIDLPNPGQIKVNPFDLRRAIENRQSICQFTLEPLSLQELS